MKMEYKTRKTDCKTPKMDYKTLLRSIAFTGLLGISALTGCGRPQKTESVEDIRNETLRGRVDSYEATPLAYDPRLFEERITLRLPDHTYRYFTRTTKQPLGLNRERRIAVMGRYTPDDGRHSRWPAEPVCLITCTGPDGDDWEPFTQEDMAIMLGRPIQKEKIPLPIAMTTEKTTPSPITMTPWDDATGVWTALSDAEAAEIRDNTARRPKDKRHTLPSNMR